MNILEGIKKKIIILIVNKVLYGTHFFVIKQKLLNQCEGISIGKGTKIVSPIHFPRMCHLENACRLLGWTGFYVRGKWMCMYWR